LNRAVTETIRNLLNRLSASPSSCGFLPLFAILLLKEEIVSPEDALRDDQEFEELKVAGGTACPP
jgi:hypothetical protein